MAAISKCCFAAVLAIYFTVLGGRNSLADDQSAGAAQSFTPRPPAEMRSAVTESLRASALAKDPQERDSAGRQLVSILLELEQDRKLPRDDRVQLHALVRARLLTLEKTLRAQQARQAEHGLASNPKSAKEVPSELPQSTSVLAQVAAPAAAARPGGAAAVAGAFGGIGRAGPASAVVGQSQGPDYGQDLVDLIHAVVQPRTWDINGGPGSVVYYRNFKLLVVTAPSEVHSEIGDLLGQLRK